MPRFDHSFVVQAPQGVVLKQHRHPQFLCQLMPPLLSARVDRAAPIDEGAEVQITVAIGRFTLYWQAVHLDVREDGFTDVQLRGPLQLWQHRHRFVAIPSPGNTPLTRVEDHVIYRHFSGWRGLLSRLFFNRVSLWYLFTYRKHATRRALASERPASRHRMVKAGLLLMVIIILVRRIRLR